MRAVAHGWKKPGGGGPSKAVAKEFTAADKGRKFGSGGPVKESKEMADKEIKALKRGHAPKEVMDHEKQEHKEMGYKKGGSAHHKGPPKGGAGITPALLASMAGPPPGAPPGPMGPGPGAPPGMPGAGGPPPPGMAHGGHVIHGGHHTHHHHYAHGGHVGGPEHDKETKNPNADKVMKHPKGAEAIIGGKKGSKDGPVKKGHTKGKVVHMKRGGSSKEHHFAHGGHVGHKAHSRGDGIAMKGHTKGRIV
jgi:hypothetical protein